MAASLGQRDNLSTTAFSNFSLNTPTNQTSFFLLYYKSCISYVTIGLCICLFAIVSNVVCLVAILSYSPLRQRGNYLVANLTVVAILLSLTGHPVIFVQIVYRQFNWMPPNFCDYLAYYYFLMHSLMWHECFIALNRFVALILPNQYKAISRKFAVGVTISLGYLIAFTVNVYPLTTRVHVYVSALPFGNCAYNPKHESFQFFPVLQALFGVYLPMGVVGLCYTVLFSTISARSAQRTQVQPTAAAPRARHQLLQQKKRLRLARMLFASFVWNALTYLIQPLIQAFFTNFYVIYPSALFYIRSITLLGVAGNAVSRWAWPCTMRCP